MRQLRTKLHEICLSCKAVFPAFSLLSLRIFGFTLSDQMVDIPVHLIYGTVELKAVVHDSYLSFLMV